ncbi:ATP-binding protein [Bryobacter aggregatus]|uniref:ATP-binding protein n=1 Tax=Bryobacter aggregatus TaxID=360054 RepID=UPI00068BAF5B|nr:PAS domain-containing sensor histidine kinase [Bryobacter aggregatus]
MPTRLTILGLPLPETSFRRHYVLPLTVALIGLLAGLEWYLHIDYSLGILYVFPIMAAATVLGRFEIIVLAVTCAYIRGLFTPQEAQLEHLLRFAMATLAFSGLGLLVVEMSRNRRTVLAYYASLGLEQELRRKAEHQLRILVESSPAAILTIDHSGTIVAANRSASEMFLDEAKHPLVGRQVSEYVATLGNALQVPSGPRQMRASAWTWGRKADSSAFPIATWFSTYGEGRDRHLAAIIVDVSEEIRDRERENFKHLLDYNRLLAGAVSHEIRNLCSAASVLCSVLSSREDLKQNADFNALSHLIEGLSHMASFELRKEADAHAAAVSIPAVLQQLRIIIEPDWRDNDSVIDWRIADNLPEVHADAHGLLQIFLNLTQNSLRAVSDSEVRELCVQATQEGQGVRLSFNDSGPGLMHPDELFQPFRPNSDGTGLGLYISRMLARSFGGDLIHIPTKKGCQFDVTLHGKRKPHL